LLVGGVRAPGERPPQEKFLKRSSRTQRFADDWIGCCLHPNCSAPSIRKKENHTMRFNAAVPACLAALSMLTAAHAQAPGALQVVTPDQYRALPVAERQLYVAGVLDTMLGFNLPTHAMFAQCLPGVTASQLVQVVDQRLPDLPPVERSDMPVAVHNALLHACLDRGYKME
jgi:hypothetical protein